MLKKPTALGLILCERVDVDRATGRFSLLGLFQSRHFRQYPTPPQTFTVYGALFDGMGEGTLELVVVWLATDQKIYRYQRWLAFSSRLMTVHMEVKLKRCIFPAAGRYDVILRFDGEEVSHRYLDVVQD